MTPTNVTTIAMPPQDFWGLVFVVGLILCSGLIYLALAQLGKPYRAPEWERLPTIGIALLVPLGILWVGLFLLTIWAAFWGTYQLLNPPPPGQTPISSLGALGLGTLLAGLLGAPFLIWGTILKHRTVGFQKEGHLTERISKAVEQLGAEKRVDRIGRPVTIWTGKPERYSVWEKGSERYLSKPRTLVTGRDFRREWNHETDDVDEGYELSVSTWPAERTVIQWQSKGVEVGNSETVGQEGEWKVFSETLPNIEVRIGGILSLERIAQDSTAYDRGRDHVRVMEILCAYIRENAPASGAKDHDFGEWEPLKDDPTDAERAAHLAKCMERFGGYGDESKVWMWAQEQSEPRADIALALRVIGRRDAKQRLAEASWGKEAGADTEWVFDTARPTLPDAKDNMATTAAELAAYRAELKAWQNTIAAYKGYRIDLRKTNLQRADLSELILSGARLDGARLEGADLCRARLEGADISQARMDGAELWDARMEGATLIEVRLEGQTSIMRGCRGQTSDSRGWTGQTSRRRGWRGQTCGRRGWRGKPHFRADGGSKPDVGVDAEGIARVCAVGGSKPL